MHRGEAKECGEGIGGSVGSKEDEKKLESDVNAALLIIFSY